MVGWWDGGGVTLSRRGLCLVPVLVLEAGAAAGAGTACLAVISTPGRQSGGGRWRPLLDVRG